MNKSKPLRSLSKRPPEVCMFLHVLCDLLSSRSPRCLVTYASEMCDVLNHDLFSACHEYLSPTPFHQQCRADTCKCGTPCLCSALAHYARHCRRFSVIIDFRSHVSDCGECSKIFCLQAKEMLILRIYLLPLEKTSSQLAVCVHSLFSECS